MDQSSLDGSQSALLTCVILAAGTSSRLYPLTAVKPKCLLEIGGKTLLERTIRNILDAGVKDIALVVGYRGEMIQEFIKQHFAQQHIRFVLNPNFASTNNTYSLLLARRFLENEDGNVSSRLLLLDSDILFSSKLLPFFLKNSLQNCIAVRVCGEHNDEEIRVKRNSIGDIVLIGKSVALSETYGESIGIEMFSPETTASLFTILKQRIQNGSGRTEFYETSFQELIDRGIKLKAVDVSAFPAIEIDTEEDLQLAERMNIV